MKRGFLILVVLILLIKTCIPQTVQTRFSTDNVSVILKIDKTEYIKGQLIDILVAIKNNTNDTIDFPILHYSEFLTHLNLTKTIEGGHFITENDTTEKIGPHGEYLFYVSPTTTVRYNEHIDGVYYPWNFFPVGNYEYYLSWNYNDFKIESNRINFSILPAPDSLLPEIDDLKYDGGLNNSNFNQQKYLFEHNELLLKKNLGKYFEREYFVHLLRGHNFLDALMGNEKAKKIYPHVYETLQEYIQKYPSTSEAFEYLYILYMYRDYMTNAKCLKEIIRKISLTDSENKSNKKYSELLNVLQSNKNLQSQLNKNMKGVEK